MDRRRTPRAAGVNAKIFVHDRAYEVLDWSSDGFRIRIAETTRGEPVIRPASSDLRVGDMAQPVRALRLPCGELSEHALGLAVLP